jgi:hypothetical protein
VTRGPCWCCLPRRRRVRFHHLPSQRDPGLLTVLWPPGNGERRPGSGVLHSSSVSLALQHLSSYWNTWYLRPPRDWLAAATRSHLDGLSLLGKRPYLVAFGWLDWFFLLRVLIQSQSEPSTIPCNGLFTCFCCDITRQFYVLLMWDVFFQSIVMHQWFSIRDCPSIVIVHLHANVQHILQC